MEFEVNAQKGLAELNKIIDALKEANDRLQDIAETSSTVDDATEVTADKLADLAKEAGDAFSAIRKSVKSMEDSSSAFNTILNDLEKMIKEVGENTEVGKQFRALATNAAIEFSDELRRGLQVNKIITEVMTPLKSQLKSIKTEMWKEFADIPGNPPSIPDLPARPTRPVGPAGIDDDFSELVQYDERQLAIAKAIKDIEKERYVNFLQFAAASEGAKTFFGTQGRAARAIVPDIENYVQQVDELRGELKALDPVAAKTFGDAIIESMEFGKSVDAITLDRIRQEVYGLIAQIDNLGEEAGVSRLEMIELAQQYIKVLQGKERMDIRSFAALGEDNDIRLAGLRIAEKMIQIKQREEEIVRKAAEAAKAKTLEEERQKAVLEQFITLRKELNAIPMDEDRRKTLNFELAKAERGALEDKNFPGTTDPTALIKDMITKGETLTAQNIRQASALSSVARILREINTEKTNQLDLENKTVNALEQLRSLAGTLSFNDLEPEEIERLNQALLKSVANLTRLDNVSLNLPQLFLQAKNSAESLTSTEIEMLNAARPYYDQITRIKTSLDERLVQQKRILAVEQLIAKIEEKKKDLPSQEPEYLGRYYVALNKLREMMIRSDISIEALTESWDAYNKRTIVADSNNAELIAGFKALTPVVKSTQSAVDSTAISMETLVRFTEFRFISQAFYSLSGYIQQASTRAMEFGTAIAQIQTISKNIPLAYDTWSDSLQRLSESYNLDLMDTATATYQALSNQMAEGSNIFSFMEESARLAKATVSSLTASVDTLSGVLNAYGLSAESSRKITNELFNAVDLGRITVEQLASTSGRVAGIAKKVGLSTGEMFTGLAVLTRGGLSTEEALTQQKNLLSSLIDPSEALSKLYKEWGVSNIQAAQAAFGFTGILERLKVVSDSSATELEELVQNIRAFLPALTLTGNLTQFERDLAVIESGAQDVTQALGTIQKDFSQVLGSQIQVFRNSMTQTMTEWLQFLAKIQTSRDEATKNGTAMLPGIGLGDIVGTVTEITVQVGIMMAAFKGATFVFQLFDGIRKYADTSVKAVGWAVEGLMDYNKYLKVAEANNVKFKAAVDKTGMSLMETGGKAKLLGTGLAGLAGTIGIVTSLLMAIESVTNTIRDANRTAAFNLIKDEDIRKAELFAQSLAQVERATKSAYQAMTQASLEPLTKAATTINTSLEETKNGVIALLRAQEKAITQESNSMIKDLERQSKVAAKAITSAYDQEEANIDRESARKSGQKVSAADRRKSKQLKALGEKAFQEAQAKLEAGDIQGAADLISKSESLYNKAFSANSKDRSLSDAKFDEIAQFKEYVSGLDQTERLDPQLEVERNKIQVKEEERKKAIQDLIDSVSSNTDPKEIALNYRRVEKLIPGSAASDLLQGTYNINGKEQTGVAAMEAFKQLNADLIRNQELQAQKTKEGQDREKADTDIKEGRIAFQQQGRDLGDSLLNFFNQISSGSAERVFNSPAFANAVKMQFGILAPSLAGQAAQNIDQARTQYPIYERLMDTDQQKAYRQQISDALETGTPEGLAKAKQIVAGISKDFDTLDKSGQGAAFMGQSDFTDALIKFREFEREFNKTLTDPETGLAGKIDDYLAAIKILEEDQRKIRDAGDPNYVNPTLRSIFRDDKAFSLTDLITGSIQPPLQTDKIETNNAARILGELSGLMVGEPLPGSTSQLPVPYATNVNKQEVSTNYNISQLVVEAGPGPDGVRDLTSFADKLTRLVAGNGYTGNTPNGVPQMFATQ